MREAVHNLVGSDSVLALRFFYSIFAECLAVHGDYREAESVNQKARALSQSGQKWGEIIGCRTMALLAAADSNPDWNQVESYMGKSIQLAKEKAALPELFVCLIRSADLSKQKGDTERAASYWNQAQDLAKQIGRQVLSA